MANLKSLCDNSNILFNLVLVSVNCFFSLFMVSLAFGRRKVFFCCVLDVLVIMLGYSYFNLLLSRQFCCLGLACQLTYFVNLTV